MDTGQRTQRFSAAVVDSVLLAATIRYLIIIIGEKSTSHANCQWRTVLKPAPLNWSIVLQAAHALKINNIVHFGLNVRQNIFVDSVSPPTHFRPLQKQSQIANAFRSH